MNTHVFRGEYTTPPRTTRPTPTRDLPTHPLDHRTHSTDTQSDLQALGRRVRSSALEVLLVVGLVGVRVGVPLLHDLHVARALCSKLVSKYVFRLPPQQPAVLNTCICSFSEPHFEYTEYVFDMYVGM